MATRSEANVALGTTTAEIDKNTAIETVQSGSLFFPCATNPGVYAVPPNP